MRTTRATRVCVGDAPCTRAPTRTRAPRRTRCAATPRPLCLPPRPLPTTHPRKHPVHTKPSPCTAFLPTTPRMALARRRAGAHARPCRACARRALARCPLRLPPPIANPPRPRSHQTPTRGLLPPAPGPRSASRRRPPLPMPCPCARRPLACAAPLPSHGVAPACRHSALHSLLPPCAARPLPSLVPSHGDAPAPGARPAVTLPAGRCPPPARALHACAAPLPSHGVAPAPGPGTRLPRPSPPPARCPPCLSRIPMGAPQPGEGSPPEDGRPTR